MIYNEPATRKDVIEFLVKRDNISIEQAESYFANTQFFVLAAIKANKSLDDILTIIKVTLNLDEDYLAAFILPS